MCGEDTGSGPRHNITLPPCLLCTTGLRGQKQLNDSMAKVMGNRERLPVIFLRTAAPMRAGLLLDSARLLELAKQSAETMDQILCS